MKPHLTIEQQVLLLAENGLIVTDLSAFSGFLQKQNYYRLRGYFHPFLVETNGVTSNRIKPYSSDRLIMELVEFDRQLRSLLFEVLAVFETQFRSVLAYYVGEENPYAHHDGSGLSLEFTNAAKRDKKSDHEKWFDGYQYFLTRHRQNDIVIKYNTHHGGKLPIWSAVELIDFGSLSRLFGGLSEPSATNIANEFGSGGRFMSGYGFPVRLNQFLPGARQS